MNLSRLTRPRTTGIWAAFFAAALAFLCLAGAPSSAFASCIPSEGELSAYAADGTLASRQAYQKALGNDSFDQELIDHALAKEGAANARSRVPSGWKSGMATTGTAKVLAIRVAFPAEGDEPAMGFEQEDSLDALQALINGQGGQAPYESLKAFYQRSSYGALSFEGQAFDYTAQHARSHYTDDVDALFREAVTALKEQGIDLEQFDGNGDKVIDGVYIHFAGGTSGWGTTWWSNQRHSSKREIEGTDMSIDSEVLLHEASCDEDASRVVIHETGHTLGLPDYYSYETDASSGIDTFDMMGNDSGDHCAFSKWLLGWVDDDAITRMVVSEDGVTVQDASGTQRHETTVEQALSAFESDNPSETGGFIAVSNDDGILDGEGLFSSFYLLQYDQKAGNNRTDAVPDEPGFRMYRVQASLNERGTDFEKSNAYGTDGDKLIEALNLEYRQASYLLEGDSVTPTTKPSTNFFEDVGRGYTGIAVTVQETQAAQGMVNISYEPVDPVDPGAFSVSLEGGSDVLCVDKRTLELSLPATLSPQAGISLDAQLYIEGIEYPETILVQTEGDSYTVSWTLASKNFKPGTKAQLVFPEGFFALGRGAEGPVYSPEVRIDLASSEKNLVTESTGYYESTRQPEGSDYDCLSNVLAVGEDKVFFQAHVEPTYEGEAVAQSLAPSDSCVMMSRIAGNDASQCSTTVVKGTEGSWLEDWLNIRDVAPSADDLQGITALPAGNGIIALNIVNTSRSMGQTRSVLAFVDEETGTLLAQCEGPSGESGHWLSWNGKTIYAEGNAGMVLLTAYEPDGEGGVKKTYSYVMGAEGFYDVGNSQVLAYVSSGGETPGYTLELLSADAEGSVVFCDSIPEAEDRAVPLTDIPSVSFASEGSVEIEAAAASSDALWVCSRNFGTPSSGGAMSLVNCLTKYSFAGEVTRCEYDRPSESDVPNVRLSVGDSGLAAVQWNSQKYDKGQGLAFFDQGLGNVKYSTSYGTSRGLWIGSHFLQIGYPLRSASEDTDAEVAVRYDAYQPNGPDPVVPVDPDGPSAPDTPSADQPGSPDGKMSTAKTGDALQGMLPLLGAVAVVALVAAVVSIAVLRRRK